MSEDTLEASPQNQPESGDGYQSDTGKSDSKQTSDMNAGAENDVSEGKKGPKSKGKICLPVRTGTASPTETHVVPDSPSSATSESSSFSSRSSRPCLFFASGTCRNGDKCRFSHAPSPSGAQTQSFTPPPPPMMINLPVGHPVYSVDVECVATGVQHNARSVAQVALVDEWCRPVFSVYVKQDLPVLSYITELTGLTKEILDTHGLPLAEALALLRANLPPNAILIGQSIMKDVQWLQLAEGVDYFRYADTDDRSLHASINPSLRVFMHEHIHIVIHHYTSLHIIIHHCRYNLNLHTQL